MAGTLRRPCPRSFYLTFPVCQPSRPDCSQASCPIPAKTAYRPLVRHTETVPRRAEAPIRLAPSCYRYATLGETLSHLFGDHRLNPHGLCVPDHRPLPTSEFSHRRSRLAARSASIFEDSSKSMTRTFSTSLGGPLGVNHRVRCNAAPCGWRQECGNRRHAAHEGRCYTLNT
jgi:hypothetical protein